MQAYSLDMRRRALHLVEQGMTQREVHQVFGLSQATLERWVRRQREEGQVAAREITGRPRLVGVSVHPQLQDQLHAHPDATLAEHLTLWQQEHGQHLSRATMARAILRVGYTRKKRA